MIMWCALGVVETHILACRLQSAPTSVCQPCHTHVSVAVFFFTWTLSLCVFFKNRVKIESEKKTVFFLYRFAKKKWKKRKLALSHTCLLPACSKYINTFLVITQQISCMNLKKCVLKGFFTILQFFNIFFLLRQSIYIAYS